MQLINYIEHILHSSIKLVEQVTQLVRIVDSAAPPATAATEGEKESQAQPDPFMETSDDDILKQVMPYMEEGGSTPHLPNLHHFRAAGEGPITLKEAKLQMQEEEELAAIEAKRVKMMDEYNHCINFRDDPLPITNFSCRVSKSTKIASMRVTRNKQPLNYKIFDNFKLKELGFSEWVATTAGKLGIPPLSQLIVFETTPAEKKRVVGKAGLVIKEAEAGIFLYNGNFDLVFQRRSEYQLASTTQLTRN
ncbi:hypothetical protein Tco_1040106 [Tanacetum coccineum]